MKTLLAILAIGCLWFSGYNAAIGQGWMGLIYFAAFVLFVTLLGHKEE